MAYFNRWSCEKDCIATQCMSQFEGSLYKLTRFSLALVESAIRSLANVKKKEENSYVIFFMEE